ncbi:MAG: Eco57I restriction-modification methylase domain-containing protein, partial [Bacilli bacterium]
MRFDVVVGNPPYQDENVGSNNQATPVYNYFYDLAETIANKYSLISPARFLSNQGATPKAWNKKMLSDNHLKIEYFNAKSNEVFPNVDIKGGVVVLHRDNNKDFGAIETFIPFDELRNIYYKVKKTTKGNISGFVYSPDSYRFNDELFKEHPELVGRTDDSHAKAVASSVFTRYPEIFSEDKPNDGEDYIQIYGRLSRDRVYRWVK